MPTVSVPAGGVGSLPPSPFPPPGQLPPKAEAELSCASSCLFRSSSRWGGSVGPIDLARDNRGWAELENLSIFIAFVLGKWSDLRRNFSFHTVIEDLTHKTGNFKQFSIFCNMLESALTQVRTSFRAGEVSVTQSLGCEAVDGYLMHAGCLFFRASYAHTSGSGSGAGYSHTHKKIDVLLGVWPKLLMRSLAPHDLPWWCMPVISEFKW